MNVTVGRFGILAFGVFLVGTAAADTPKPTQAEARAKIEAQTLALAQAKCEKKDKVALAEHVKGAFMIKCVSPDDPEYKAQQSAKVAQ
jgi:hypothetical protein